MGVVMNKNIILNGSNKIRHDDITTLANSIAYITHLVSKNSDEVSELKKALIDLSLKVEQIEKNSD